MATRRSLSVRRRSDEGVDPHFGTIHPIQTSPRFSLRSHWRVSAAILLLATGAAGFLGESLDRTVATAPLPKPATAMARSRRLSFSMPKKGRIWQPQLAEAAKLDLVERMGDGTLAQSSYFDVSLDLAEEEQNPPAPTQRPVGLANGAAPAQADGENPFNLVLNDAVAASRSGSRLQLGYVEGTPPKPPVLGVPINVSVAAPQPLTRHLRRLVTLPVHEEALTDIEGTVDVPEAEFARLASDLGARSVKPGEELDVILGPHPDDAQKMQIVLARHVSSNRRERILARCDDGHFQEVSDRELYERMAAEALAAEQSELDPDAAQLSPADRDALSQAANDYPQLLQHLVKSHVPPRVRLQVVELLKANGIHWDDDADLPRIDLVFRKVETGDQDLVSVTLRSDGKDRHFYRYVSQSGKVEFYDGAGRSVSKTLMHKPVPAGQIGDGFGWRVHPILRTRKFHNGVDFRAPLGSPILAAGDGVVVKIDYEGGYGKYIRIRHDGGYTTTYAHIEGTPKGLKVGDRVSQGEVIAYVGSTGLSTGPHLYYELKVGDSYEDPTKVQMPAGTTLRGGALAEFRQQVDHVETIAEHLRDSAKLAAHKVANALVPGDGVKGE